MQADDGLSQLPDAAKAAPPPTDAPFEELFLPVALRATNPDPFMQADEGEPKSRPPDAAGAAPPPAEAPFEELYCASFAALDRHWLAAQATYMEFPAVMA